MSEIIRRLSKLLTWTLGSGSRDLRRGEAGDVAATLGVMRPSPSSPASAQATLPSL